MGDCRVERVCLPRSGSKRRSLRRATCANSGVGPGDLKPSKRLLLDLVVPEKTLDTAQDVANQLFQLLKSKAHRGVLAPTDRHYVLFVGSGITAWEAGLAAEGSRYIARPVR